jgi:hypothetical protein
LAHRTILSLQVRLLAVAEMVASLATNSEWREVLRIRGKLDVRLHKTSLSTFYAKECSILKEMATRAASGQGRPWPAGGSHSRSTPSFGDTPCVPALTLRAKLGSRNACSRTIGRAEASVRKRGEVRNINNPPAPDTTLPAARRGRRRRGCGRRERRQDLPCASGLRRPRPASRPSSAPGCAGTSAPR